MSATARAEARRKAILARGTDRLNKLTTSARSEDGDAPQRFTPEPAPRPVSTFLGESAPLPTTPPRPTASRQPSSSPSPFAAARHTQNQTATNGGGDPSVWGADQQQQFMRALMGAGLAGELPDAAPNPNPNPNPDDPFAALLSSLTQAQGQSQSYQSGGAPPPNPDDPFGALLTTMLQGQGQPQPGADSIDPQQQIPAFATAPRAPTRIQRLLPVLHVLSVWALLAYFVAVLEPGAFFARTRGAPAAAAFGFATRWGGLLRAPGAALGAWGVQAVPFFSALLTLELALFSLRIFAGIDPPRPAPFLLQLALPHLPAPLPSLIGAGFRYVQMAGVLADDGAALLVALGVLVWGAAWAVGGSTS